MTQSEDEARRAVVAEAQSWIGTPYAHRGRMKGAGGCVDCLQFIWSVYHACDLAPYIDLQEYAPDEHLHRGEERYLNGILEHSCEVEFPRIADVAIFKMGRLFWHGAIVTGSGWPNIIHACGWSRPPCVTLGRGDGGLLNGRDVRFFSKWAR